MFFGNNNLRSILSDKIIYHLKVKLYTLYKQLKIINGLPPQFNGPLHCLLSASFTGLALGINEQDNHFCTLKDFYWIAQKRDDFKTAQGESFDHCRFEKLQLGDFHRSKMDLIQILVIFCHKELNLILSF